MEDNLIYIDNSIFTKNPYIYLNLNTGIEKNLYIRGNTVGEDLIIKNYADFKGLLKSNTILNDKLIGNKIEISDTLKVRGETELNKSLIVKDKSILEKDVVIYGNLNVIGKSLKVLSERTLISDPLVIFGLNQNAVNDDQEYGGFVINYNFKNNEHYSGLVRHPKTSNFHLYDNLRAINNKTGEPNLTDDGLGDTKYANLFLNNLNIIDTCKVGKNINTSILNVSGISNLKKKLTLEDDVKGPFYEFKKSTNKAHFTGDILSYNIIPSTTAIYNLGSPTHKFKALYLDGNSLHLGDEHIKLQGNVITFSNLRITNNITSKNLEIQNTSYFEKSVKLNSNFDVNGSSYFEKSVMLNSNVSGNYFEFNSINETLRIEGNVSTHNLLPINTKRYNLGSNSYRFNDLFLQENINIKNKIIKTTGDFIDTDNFKVNINLNTLNLDSFNISNFKGNLNILENYNFQKWKTIKTDNGVNIQLPQDSEIVPITYGGTGGTTHKQARDNLFINLGARGSIDGIKTSNFMHGHSYSVNKYYFQPYSYPLSYIDYIHNSDPNVSQLNWSPNTNTLTPLPTYYNSNHGVLRYFKIDTWKGTPNLNVIQNLTFSNQSILNNQNSDNFNTGALVINGGVGIHKNLYIGGNLNVLENINSNNLIIKENSVLHNVITNVDGISNFKGQILVNNNILGEYYNFDNTNQLISIHGNLKGDYYELNKLTKTLKIDGNTIVQQVFPKFNNTYSLGNDNSHFKNLYLSSEGLYLNKHYITSDSVNIKIKDLFIDNNLTASQLKVNGKSYFNDDINGTFYNITKGSKTIKINGTTQSETLLVNKNTTLNNTEILENLNVLKSTKTVILNVSSTSVFDDNVHIKKMIHGPFYKFDNNTKKTTIEGDILSYNIIPNKTATYNLGSPTHKFKSLYIEGNSLHIGTEHMKIENNALTFDNLKLKRNLNVNGFSYFDKEVLLNSNLLGNL